MATQGNSPKSRKYDPRAVRRPSDTRQDQQAFALHNRFQPTSAGGSGGSPSVNDFRLTLAPGFAVYNPLSATPSSTDTTNETVTFATDPGWVTGTIATVSATGGGLTAASLFYLRRRSATLYSCHGTIAGALADTGKIDLTASITAAILPSGITNTTLYLSPFVGNTIGLYDGTSWAGHTSAEVSIALGTLTSGKNYDVFAYNNAGTLTLALLAWTDDVTRATALSQQDGIWVKSTDATRRYVGTIRTDSTTTTMDDAGGIASQVGGRRFVWNIANRMPLEVYVYNGNSSWNYSTATWRQADGASGNKVEAVLGLALDLVDVSVWAAGNNSGNNFMVVAIGLDSTTVPSGMYPGGMAINSSNSGTSGNFRGRLVGYHAFNWIEYATGATGAFLGFFSGQRKSGIAGSIWC